MARRRDKWVWGGVGVLVCALTVSVAVSVWMLDEKIDRLNRRIQVLETPPETPARQAAAIPDKSDAADELGGELAQVRTLVDDLALRVSAIDQAMISLRGELEKATARALGATPRVAQNPPEPPVDRWAHRERRYAEEPLDLTWSRRMETRISEAIDSSPGWQHVQLDSVECRSETCRLSWRFDEGLSGEEYFELENNFIAALAQAGLDTATTRSDGIGQQGYFFRNPEPAPDPGDEDN